MQLENDNDFNILYDVEFKKIPFVFRFGKKRTKVVIIALIVMFVSMCVLSSFWYNAYAGTEVKPYAEGLSIAMFIIGGCTVITAAWMALSKIFERHAFRNASNLAAMIRAYELHRTEMEFQNWKMWNRDY